jgi:hypothetical protein
MVKRKIPAFAGTRTQVVIVRSQSLLRLRYHDSAINCNVKSDKCATERAVVYGPVGKCLGLED